MKQKQKLVVWRFIPCLTMMVVIFLFSAMPAGDSDVASHSIADPLASFFSFLTGGGSPQDLQDSLNWLIRKLAHATEYMVLAITMMYAFWIKKWSLWKLAVDVELICLLYAITDEFHQYFVPGRYAAGIDVMIDSSGALVGVMFCVIFLKFKQKGTKKRERYDRMS